MKNRSTIDRIKAIQKHLAIEPDGIIGPDTLTAIENRLFPSDAKAREAYSLLISRNGLNQLINHEVISKSYYNRVLQKPVWPGGGSGITIGIGYDLGYSRVSQIKKDWLGKITDHDFEKLLTVRGLKSQDARKALRRVKSVKINFDAASQVFYQSSLPRYAASTRKAYPGVEELYPDAQAALLSLVYNRGTSMSGSRRREMAAIKSMVLQKDYKGIAGELRDMKRLWQGKGLDGLLKRRDDEAELILHADRKYVESKLIRL